jgi:hypothetical protein
VVRVIRGPEPEWYDAAVSANRGADGNVTWATSKRILENAKIHASETAWVGTQFDYILDNNGSIDDLFTQVKNQVLNHPASI